jgi:RNA polymerase sigma-70 factor (ECF subfamily)
MADAKYSKLDLKDEVELISSAKLGDINSFNKLIARYSQVIYNFSFKICRNEEKAKETLQDTLISIYKSLKSFDGKSKFSTWLYKVVTNNCLMMARSNKTDKTVSIDDEEYKISLIDKDIVGIYETPAQKMLDQELKDKLDKAIKKLPLKYRLVFLLRDVEDLSIEETSKILNLTKPVVKTRLHRARIFLKNQLEEYYDK